ncbi:MAG: TonB-dependent receptor [Gammaproteobacteria bacterium]|nr:TonB-dependent receptor [Gammaproteobacteria bacterium]
MKIHNAIKQVCSLLLLFVVNSNHVIAQQDDEQSLTEAEIIVSGTRSEQYSIEVPTSITVISQEDIEASGAQYLTEVLKARGAVQISDLYGDGSRSTVNMRGLSASSNTLVLVDGRRLNNSDIGEPDLNSVSIKDIERIEIVQDSASVLYGDQAVGGVINIITKVPEGLSAAAELMAGSYERKGLRLAVSNRLNNGLSFTVNGEQREADNYRQHNLVDYENLFARGGLDYSSGELFVELQTIIDEQQNPGALLSDEIEQDRRQSIADYINDYSNTDTDVARIGFRQSFDTHWKMLAEYTQRESDGEFVLSFRGSPASTADPANIQQRKVSSFNPRFIASYPTEYGEFLLTIGSDLESSEYFLQSVFGTQQNDQDIDSLYALTVIPVMRSTDLSMGWRHAEVKNNLRDRPLDFLGNPLPGVPDDADLDDDVNIGSIGLTVHAGDNLRHFIRYEENYRFAKVDEHTQSPVVPDYMDQSGDPLRTQTGDSLEIGAEWQKDGNTAKLVLYRLNLEDEILYDPGFFQNINIDSACHRGAIIEGTRRFGDSLSMGFSYSYLDARITSGTYDENEVPFTANHVIGLNLDFELGSHWYLHTEANYIDDRYFQGDFNNELEQLAGYTVANLQLAYRRGPWSMSLRINNMLNEKYSDSGVVYTAYDPVTFVPTDMPSFFPAPERNALLRISYAFEQ